MHETTALTRRINWNEQGLVPAIAQDWRSGEVLMLAWMNEQALALTRKFLDQLHALQPPQDL